MIFMLDIYIYINDICVTQDGQISSSDMFNSYNFIENHLYNEDYSDTSNFFEIKSTDYSCFTTFENVIAYIFEHGYEFNNSRISEYDAQPIN